MPDSKPNRKIFISYRRDDHPDFVARIRDWFMQRYGRDNVFMDFDSIPRFVPFADFIRETVQECDVLIAIIGPKWIELMQQKASSFQDDYVRTEITLALQHGKLVAPVCVKGAPIPAREALPSDLHPILDTNVARLESDNTFYDNIEGIMRDVENALDWRQGIRKTPKPSSVPEIETKAVGKAEAEAVQKIIDEANRHPLPSQGGERLLTDISYGIRANERYDRGDIDGAIMDYTLAMRLNPNDGWHINGRGVARDEKGDLWGAIDDYTRAIDLLDREELSLPYGNRGEAYFSLKQYPQAMNDLQIALELDPNSQMIQGAIAITHHALGNKDEARRLWQALVKQNIRFKDADWVRKTLDWGKPLAEEARKVIALL